MSGSSHVLAYGNKTVRNDRGGYPAAQWFGDTWNQGHWAQETYSPGDWLYANYNRGYVYATTYGYLSTRKSKKDIRKFDRHDYASALAFMDDLHLNFYVSRDDHMGTTRVAFIAEETPGNLTVPGKQGVLYGELNIYNTGAIKVLKEKVERLERHAQKLKDRGSGTTSGNSIHVRFSDAFVRSKNGALPVVIASSGRQGVSIAVSEIYDDGFVVQTDGMDNVPFSWIAMAESESPPPEAPQLNERFISMVSSAEHDVNTRPIPKFTDPIEPINEDSSAPWTGTGESVPVTLNPPVITPSVRPKGDLNASTDNPKGYSAKDSFVPPTPVPGDAPIKSGSIPTQ